MHEHYGGTTRAHRPSATEQRVAEQVLAAAPAATAYARIDMVAGPDSDAPMVMEAELVEPELFLRHEPEAAQRFARVLSDRRSRPSIG